MIYYPLRHFAALYQQRHRNLATFAKWFCDPWRHTNVLLSRRFMGKHIDYNEQTVNQVAYITMDTQKLLHTFVTEEYVYDSIIRIMADLEVGEDPGEIFQLHYLAETLYKKDSKIWIFDTRDPRVHEILYQFRQRFNSLREFYSLEQCSMTCYFFDGKDDLPLAPGQSWAVLDLRGQVAFDDPSDQTHIMPSGIQSSYYLKQHH